MRLLGALGAIHCAIALMFGAFAAHRFGDSYPADLIRSGSQWEAIAGVGGIVSVLVGSRVASTLLSVGACLFAFTLYALALGASDPVALFAPVGGVTMILGWLALARAFIVSPEAQAAND